MLREDMNAPVIAMPRPVDRSRLDEGAALARFANNMHSLGPLVEVTPALQARVFEEVMIVARSIAISNAAYAGEEAGYQRRVLREEPGRWSLAAVILQYGQRTEPHDHDGWGCAVTVQGIERDRRYVRDAQGKRVVSSERDYPPGTGYLFLSSDIHQPTGADPWRVTVALHLLVHKSHEERLL